MEKKRQGRERGRAAAPLHAPPTEDPATGLHSPQRPALAHSLAQAARLRLPASSSPQYQCPDLNVVASSDIVELHHPPPTCAVSLHCSPSPLFAHPPTSKSLRNLTPPHLQPPPALSAWAQPTAASLGGSNGGRALDAWGGETAFKGRRCSEGADAASASSRLVREELFEAVWCPVQAAVSKSSKAPYSTPAFSFSPNQLEEEEEEREKEEDGGVLVSLLAAGAVPFTHGVAICPFQRTAGELGAGHKSVRATGADVVHITSAPVGGALEPETGLRFESAASLTPEAKYREQQLPCACGGPLHNFDAASLASWMLEGEARALSLLNHFAGSLHTNGYRRAGTGLVLHALRTSQQQEHKRWDRGVGGEQAPGVGQASTPGPLGSPVQSWCVEGGMQGALTPALGTCNLGKSLADLFLEVSGEFQMHVGQPSFTTPEEQSSARRVGKNSLRAGSTTTSSARPHNTAATLLAPPLWDPQSGFMLAVETEDETGAGGLQYAPFKTSQGIPCKPIASQPEPSGLLDHLATAAGASVRARTSAFAVGVDASVPASGGARKTWSRRESPRHTVDAFVCGDCGKAFSSPQALGGHSTAHRKRKKITQVDATLGNGMSHIAARGGLGDEPCAGDACRGDGFFPQSLTLPLSNDIKVRSAFANMDASTTARTGEVGVVSQNEGFAGNCNVKFAPTLLDELNTLLQ